MLTNADIETSTDNLPFAERRRPPRSPSHKFAGAAVCPPQGLINNPPTPPGSTGCESLYGTECKDSVDSQGNAVSKQKGLTDRQSQDTDAQVAVPNVMTMQARRTVYSGGADGDGCLWHADP